MRLPKLILSYVMAPSAVAVAADLPVFGKEVLFGGVDAAGNIGLWVTTGTVAGTYEIISGIQGELKPANLTVFNGEVYFTQWLRVLSVVTSLRPSRSGALSVPSAARDS
jgi:hypothetical protein